MNNKEFIILFHSFLTGWILNVFKMINKIKFFFLNRPMDTKGQGATTTSAQVSFKGAIKSLQVELTIPSHNTTEINTSCPYLYGRYYIITQEYIFLSKKHRSLQFIFSFHYQYGILLSCPLSLCLLYICTSTQTGLSMISRTKKTGGYRSVKSLSGTGLASYSILQEMELRQFSGEVKSLTGRPMGNTRAQTWEAGILQKKVIRKRVISGTL